MTAAYMRTFLNNALPVISYPDVIQGQFSANAIETTNAARSIIRYGAAGPILWDSMWVGHPGVESALLAYMGANPGQGFDTQFNSYDALAPALPFYIGAGPHPLSADIYMFVAQDGVGFESVAAQIVTGDIAEPGDPGILTLADVVTRICIRGGLTAGDIDVVDLEGLSVYGYPIATQVNAADALSPLLAAYFCYGSEYDGQIHFKQLGANAVLTVNDDDLLAENNANDGNVVSTLRNQQTEFPRKITATYLDPQQNYMAVTVAAKRVAIDVKAIGEQTMSIPVVMPSDQAQQAVDKALKIAYATLEGTQQYSVPFGGTQNYLQLVAGDSVIFRSKRWIIEEVILGNGYLKLSTRYDRQSAYTSLVQSVRGNLPVIAPSPYSGPTTLIPMNLPSLRPQDTFGLYLAAASTTNDSSWRGCQVQVSYDDQVTWSNAVQMVQSSTFGTLVDNEPTGGEPLTVLVNGDLMTVTDAQIAAHANAFAIIHSTGTEVGQFEVATEDPVIVDQYALTSITRAGLGTTRTAAVAAEPFVMLGNVYFLTIDPTFVGRTIYLRAVGFGETVESAAIVSIVYEALPPNYGTGTPPPPTDRIDVDGNSRVDVNGNPRVSY